MVGIVPCYGLKWKDAHGFSDLCANEQVYQSVRVCTLGHGHGQIISMSFSPLECQLPEHRDD